MEKFESEIMAFVSNLLNGSGETALERKVLKMSLISLIALLCISSALYIFVGSSLQISSRIPFLAYTLLSSVAIVASITHFRAHQREFSCMHGMMIGMTIGMAAGFLFGAIIGATNGMFVGSIFGMAVGMLTGAYCGKCCGIMGVMEGMMAGVMGGTMGAMLTVMMLNDNLLAFMALFFVACMAILASFAYMLYEARQGRHEHKLATFGSFFFSSLLLAAIAIAIILYGPKGPITV